MNNYYAPFQRPIQPVNGYYNPSFSVGQDMPYQQQQMAQQPFAPQSQPSGDMIWVLNETEAMSYPVAPNSNVILWDKNNDTVYLKSANMQGVPSIRILDYAERVAENAPKTPVNANSSRGAVFVRSDAFDALRGEFDALRRDVDAIKGRASKQKAVKAEKQEDTDDE